MLGIVLFGVERNFSTTCGGELLTEEQGNRIIHLLEEQNKLLNRIGNRLENNSSGDVIDAIESVDATLMDMAEILNTRPAGGGYPAPPARRVIRKGTNLSDDIGPAMKGDVILAYADGSALHNGMPYQQASGASLVVHKHRAVTRGKFLPKGSNNQGELTAIRMALKDAIEIRGESDTKIIIVSDSEYAINSVEGRYKKAKKNIELIAGIQNELSIARRGGEVEIKWVRGHQGNPANELVDTVAAVAVNTEKDVSRIEFDLGDEDAAGTNMTAIADGLAPQ